MKKILKVTGIFLLVFLVCLTGCKKKTKCEKDGHTWSDATCKTPKHCLVCDIEEGNPLPHTEVKDDAVEATCTTKGLTEGSHCSVCKTVINKQNDVPEKGHTWVDATYYVAKTCSVCNATEGDPLPMPTSVVVPNNSISVYMGETIKLTHTVLPSTVNQEVTYSMTKAEGGDGTISEDGTFTAISEGYVYIRISSKELAYISTTITIKVLHPLLEDVAYDAFNIMTGYGTDASTEVEINYHTRNIYTSVEYTLATDTDFNNVTVVTGEGYYFTQGTDKVVVRGILKNPETRVIFSKKTNSQYNLFSGVITNYKDSIAVKRFFRQVDEEFFTQKLQHDTDVEITGSVQWDDFANDVVIMADKITIRGKDTVQVRFDEAEVKRVELHAHTKMSIQDSCLDVDKYVKTAKIFGHKALAVTDHNNCHVLPEFFSACKKNGIKADGTSHYAIEKNPHDKAEYTAADLAHIHSAVDNAGHNQHSRHPTHCEGDGP